MGKRRSWRPCKYCGNTPRRGQGICRACESRPKAENIRRLKIRLSFEAIFGFLTQSNISNGNRKTLDSLTNIDDEAFRSVLDLVQDIARLHPRKCHRWKWLQRNHPDLWDRIRQNEHFDWLLDWTYQGLPEEDPWETDELDYINTLLSEQHDAQQPEDIGEAFSPND